MVVEKTRGAELPKRNCKYGKREGKRGLTENGKPRDRIDRKAERVVLCERGDETK